MKKLVNKYVHSEDGATAIEYGLIVALIAIAIVTGLRASSQSINDTFSNVATNLEP